MDLICGRRPVWEMLQAGKRRVHKLWVLENSHGAIESLLKLAHARGIPMETVHRDRLDKMVGANHQGIVAETSATSFQDLSAFLKALIPSSSSIVVALDEIQDPQNIGAILRSAGFFGVKAVIVPHWRSAPIGDTALRVSSGAAEHLTLIQVHNLVQALDECKDHGFDVLGADMAGRPVRNYKRSLRTVLVLGSEGKGLRRLVREHCDQLVGIPGQGAVGSLNVAAATAILLYELSKPM